MTFDASTLAMFALDTSVRAALAALAVALVLRGFRITAPEVRHAAWTTVVAAMLLMPLLPSMVPALPIPTPASAQRSDEPVTDEPIAPANPGTTSVVAPPSRERVIIAAASPTATDDAYPTWRALLLMTIYATGTLLMLGRVVYGWILARAMIRRGTPTDRDRVLESSDVAVPLTAGVVRPVIILPPDWRTWPTEKLEAVLAHEMAHVARRDPLVGFIARVNRALFWFHPVAWWLERTLAVTAEHACDEVAARAIREPRRYAEILVEMADVVRRNRGRVVWQGVGVDGGLLRARIDRVLCGVSATPLTRSRKAAALLSCGAAILIVVACRQQVPDLAPDAELSRQLAEEDARMKKFEGVKALTDSDVDALEQRLAANPQDFETRETLVWYYTTSLTVAWEKKVPGLRRHALWLIEHAPEHDVTPPSLSPKYDPEGFAAARKLWEAHLARPDASPFLVYRAAKFLAPHDKPYAETLILRGLAMDPDSAALNARLGSRYGGFEWHSQLADLYAAAILGAESVSGTYNDLRTHVDQVNTPFASKARQTLDFSNDARLLTRVAERLVRRSGRNEEESVRAARDHARALGITYLRRAIEIDPQHAPAQIALYQATAAETRNEADRLADRAHERLMMSEDITEYAKKDAVTAKSQREDARRDAQQVLEMAKSHAGDPAYSSAVMTAHQVLAAIALRDGDRDAAVRHLHDSVKVPASDRIKYAPTYAWSRPVNRLLKDGERERIIAFLESYAQLTVRDRQRLLDDARAIREGRMPVSYQHMMNREWNRRQSQQQRAAF